MTNLIADRDLRQRDIVPPQALARCQATVVGVGAIGRQVALQLAAMGVPWLRLIDHDIVEAVNLAPQGFLEEDLGRPKVQVTADMCRRINSQLEVLELQERFRRTSGGRTGGGGGASGGGASGGTSGGGGVLFCCVDSIQTRRHIWDAVKDRVELFVDGRMAAEVVRVLTAGDAAGRAHYPTTLFAAAEAHGGSCTAKSTIFTANIAAGLMLQQFSRWLRRMPLDADVQLNLLASEMSCGEPTPGVPAPGVP